MLVRMWKKKGGELFLLHYWWECELV
jgi:hypothetical protein